MIPTQEIVFFESDKSIEELIVKAHLDPHTRFPICTHGDIHQIQGYINFKELLFLAKNNPMNPSLPGIIRPVRFVSPDTSLNFLLRGFIEEHNHIAIVQDPEGKTLGLITLEDIIEEFLGEIEDEFDRLPKWVHSLSGGTWTVGGGIYWGELVRRINRRLDFFPGTLSDWLLFQFKKSPKAGALFTHGDLDFVVRRMRRGKIFEVMILPKG
jgi:putative hemolysin